MVWRCGHCTLSSGCRSTNAYNTHHQISFALQNQRIEAVWWIFIKALRFYLFLLFLLHVEYLVWMRKSLLHLLSESIFLFVFAVLFLLQFHINIVWRIFCFVKILPQPLPFRRMDGAVWLSTAGKGMSVTQYREDSLPFKAAVLQTNPQTSIIL